MLKENLHASFSTFATNMQIQQCCSAHSLLSGPQPYINVTLAPYGIFLMKHCYWPCTFSTKSESFSGLSLMSSTCNTFDNIYQTLSFTHESCIKYTQTKLRAINTGILISNFSSQHVMPSRFKPPSILY